MKTNRQLLRERVERVLPRRLPPLDRLRKSEWSPDFEQLMRNRLLMGSFRYGLFEEKVMGDLQWDLIGSIVSRIERYKQTGNLELLADIANLAMLEFVIPSVRGACLKPEDDGEHVERV